MMENENMLLTEAHPGNRLEQVVTDEGLTEGKSQASVRVNLSVPASLDRLLTRFALLSGRSKSSVVLEMLVRNTQHMKRAVQYLESLKDT